MKQQSRALSAERLKELMSILGDDDCEPGPLDLEDLGYGHHERITDEERTSLIQVLAVQFVTAGGKPA